MLDDLNLRRVYADICRGYSTATWRGEPIYIKHLTHYDQVDIDVYYEGALRAAKGRGFKTRAERLKWLSDKGLWARRDDSDLDMQRAYVDNLDKTRSKLYIQSQIKGITQTLNEAREKLFKDIRRRDDLIGLTCEQVAEQRVQFHYVYLSCFRDRALTQPVFTLDDLAQIDDDESDELITFYVAAIRCLDIEAIRRASLAPYFTNHFYLCGEHLHTFFGKPVCDLTSHQVNLLSYGMYYKNILSANKVPDEIKNNPDKLEEYVNKSAAFKAAIAKTGGEGGRIGIVGATPDDFKALGVEDSTKTMQEAAERGYTNAMDAAKDMGVTWIDP